MNFSCKVCGRYSGFLLCDNCAEVLGRWAIRKKFPGLDECGADRDFFVGFGRKFFKVDKKLVKLFWSVV